MDISALFRHFLPETLGFFFLLMLLIKCETILCDDGTNLNFLQDDQFVKSPLNVLSRARTKRSPAFTSLQAKGIVDLHNKIRGEVNPPATNMAYLVRNRLKLSLQFTGNIFFF